MPFQSESQKKYLYANEPEVAKEFEEETPEGADLPEYKPMNRGGVAGDWRDEISSHLNQQYGESQEEPQNMFDGGTAGYPSSNFDVDTGGSTTVRGMPLPSQAPSASPYAIQAPLTFNPMAGLPPTPVAPAIPLAPITSAVSPTQARPPTSIGSDPLQSYLAEQKQKLNRYGPDEQMALEQSLDKQRRGFLPNVALAGTGLADAIMQGVARAGPSNFQSNLQNRMDTTQQGQRQAFETGRAGHMAKMKQEMELAQMDPASPISRLAQRTAAPLLKEIGLSDEKIQEIPASLIGEVQTKGLSLEEIRAKERETRALREQTAAFAGQSAQTATAAQKRNQIIKATEDALKKLNPNNPLERDEYMKYKATLDRVARGEDVAQGIAGSTPKYIQNKTTGHTMISNDGGLTWDEMP